MKSKINVRLVLSVVALAASIVFCMQALLAWFSFNHKVQTEGISFQVVSDLVGDYATVVTLVEEDIAVDEQYVIYPGEYLCFMVEVTNQSEQYLLSALTGKFTFPDYTENIPLLEGAQYSRDGNSWLDYRDLDAVTSVKSSLACCGAPNNSESALKVAIDTQSTTAPETGWQSFSWWENSTGWDYRADFSGQTLKSTYVWIWFNEEVYSKVNVDGTEYLVNQSNGFFGQTFQMRFAAFHNNP